MRIFVYLRLTVQLVLRKIRLPANTHTNRLYRKLVFLCFAPACSWCWCSDSIVRWADFFEIKRNLTYANLLNAIERTFELRPTTNDHWPPGKYDHSCLNRIFLHWIYFGDFPQIGMPHSHRPDKEIISKWIEHNTFTNGSADGILHTPNKWFANAYIGDVKNLRNRERRTQKEDMIVKRKTSHTLNSSVKRLTRVEARMG